LRIDDVAHGVVLHRHAAVAGAVLVERVELPEARVDDRDADVATLDARGDHVLLVDVDRNRVAFAEAGVVVDLDVDGVIAVAPAHRRHEAHRGIAAAERGDVVTGIEELAVVGGAIDAAELAPGDAAIGTGLHGHVLTVLDAAAQVLELERHRGGAAGRRGLAVDGRATAGEDQALAALVAPAEHDVAAIRIVVVVLLDPVAIPAVGAVVVGEGVELETVFHVGGGHRGDRHVRRHLADAGAGEHAGVLRAGETRFDGGDHLEARDDFTTGGIDGSCRDL